MIVGHTKFTPDSCFGLLKQRFRKTEVGCLADIVQVVEMSANVNKAKLVGAENGAVFVNTYDWLSFFAPRFKKVPNIKSYHHFLFSSTRPGTVECKEFSDSRETVFTLLKNQTWNPSLTELPAVMHPSGLSSERQWYLYDKIRPFCPVNSADITCPLPCVARVGRTPLGTPVPSPSMTSFPSPSSSPPAKRVRMCSKCGTVGHNSRTCNKS